MWHRLRGVVGTLKEKVEGETWSRDIQSCECTSACSEQWEAWHLQQRTAVTTAEAETRFWILRRLCQHCPLSCSTNCKFEHTHTHTFSGDVWGCNYLSLMSTTDKHPRIAWGIRKKQISCQLHNLHGESLGFSVHLQLHCRAANNKYILLLMVLNKCRPA